MVLFSYGLDARAFNAEVIVAAISLGPSPAMMVSAD